MSSLYIVPTPIGNLGDITLRALQVLKEADFILAEDTRHTRKLLSHYDIKTSMTSYHAHNEHKVLDKTISSIRDANSVALVSDAGTPGISDPGFLLIREAIKQGIDVCNLPGPTAFVPALVGSGLPCDKFIFEGFLPHKKGRQTAIMKIAENDRTTVLYESPHRLVKLLGQLQVACGSERQACVAREISKIHEEFFRGTLAQCLAHFEKGTVKGEIVVILGAA